MSIKTSVRDAGGSPPSACFRHELHRQYLIVEVSAAKSFILPYPHFVLGELDQSAAGDVFTLKFTTHEVILKGTRLNELQSAFAELAWVGVRATPARYAAVQGCEGVVSITSIEVRPIQDDPH